MHIRGNAPLVRATNVKRALAIFRDPKTSGRKKSKQYNPCETCGKMIKATPCKFCRQDRMAAEGITEQDIADAGPLPTQTNH